MFLTLTVLVHICRFYPFFSNQQPRKLTEWYYRLKKKLEFIWKLGIVQQLCVRSDYTAWNLPWRARFHRLGEFILPRHWGCITVQERLLDMTPVLSTSRPSCQDSFSFRGGRWQCRLQRLRSFERDMTVVMSNELGGLLEEVVSYLGLLGWDEPRGMRKTTKEEVTFSVCRFCSGYSVCEILIPKLQLGWYIG